MCNRVTASTILLALLVILPLALVAQSRVTDFECDSASLNSPDGNHVLIWQATPQGCDGPHTLLLSHANDGRKQVLLKADAPPSVSWSPDSKHFFVVDHRSSDFASTYIFSLSGNRADPFMRMEQAPPDSFAFDHLKAGHVYLIGLRWINGEQILMKLSGHFDRPPATSFKACYLADTRGSVMRLLAEELRSYPECRGEPAD